MTETLKPTQGWVDAYEAFWNANETECANGHPFDEENTSMRPDGHRGCRTCRRDASRANRANPANRRTA